MATIDEVKSVLKEVLQLGSRSDRFGPSTALFGSIPEFDSFAVVSVVTALEERFGFAVDDEDISAETFASVGSLAKFVDRKLASL